MVKSWSYVSLEPRPGERAALLSAVAEDEDFTREADHDGEIVCVASHGTPFAQDLVESVAEHVERATVVSDTDEGPEAGGLYYERRQGELVEDYGLGGTSKSAIVDFLAREEGVNGPL